MTDRKIKDIFANQLSPLERLMAVGVFKPRPPTGTRLLTRGVAWLFSDVVYVAVTNWRLILLSDPNQKGLDWAVQNLAVLGFNEVDFLDGPFQSIILRVHQPGRGGVLKLRFKPGYNFLGSNQFDFIAAVKMGQFNFITAQP